MQCYHLPYHMCYSFPYSLKRALHTHISLHTLKCGLIIYERSKMLFVGRSALLALAQSSALLARQKLNDGKKSPSPSSSNAVH